MPNTETAGAGAAPDRTTKQPDALHYAEILENFYSGIGRIDATGAAAELRRLHADVEHKDKYAEQLGRELAAADAEARSLRAGYEAARMEIESLRAAQPAAQPSHEHQRAIMEGERNASLDAYSRVVHLTSAESRLYESAFTSGWDRRDRLASYGKEQPGAAYATLPEPITYQIAVLKACEHGDALVGWRVEPSRQSFDASMRPKRKLYTEGDMHDFADRTHALRASHGQAHPTVDDLCARIKAADDAAADRDYMLDSNDCIAILRGEWTAPLAMDKPERPPHGQAPAQLGHGGEREAFEASQYINYPAASLRRSHGATRLDNGEYLCAITQVAWEAWQARASHGQAPAGGSLRTDALCDLSYSHGLKAGWNYCASDDLAGFERAQKIGAEALRTLKSNTAQAAPADAEGCTRSHPHENMDSACRAKAAIAEMRNKAARGAEATAHDLDRFVVMLTSAPITHPAPQQEAQEPVAGQCRFPGAVWSECSPEHVRMVLANPEEWKRYEVRYLYTAPQPSPAAHGDAMDTERLDWLALAGPVQICLVIDRDLDGEIEVAIDGATGYGRTLRAAIDAARAAQEGKQ